MTKFFATSALVVTSASLLRADVSYQETVRYTGGSMVDMMRNMSSSPIGKMMGGRMGRALQDHTSTVYLKGNKMAHIGPDASTIIDLDAGTMTTIDNQRRSYTTMTFDEMNQRMKEAQEKMSRHGGNGGADIQFDVKVDDTGKTRTIDGKTAKEFVMTMTAQGQGQGQPGGGMRLRSDMWTVASETGAEELRDFYKKMATKMNYSFAAGMNPMMGSAGQGLAQLAKETSKLEGYPVQQDTSVSGVQGPMMPMMGGGNQDPNAPFLTMSTESHNFSTGPVDDSVFQLPAGYKQQQMKH
jgi:hypothetical protein